MDETNDKKETNQKLSLLTITYSKEYIIKHNIENLTVPTNTPCSSENSLSPNTIPATQKKLTYVPKNIQLPVIRKVGIVKCIDKLGTIFNLTDYKHSPIEFWYLDILSDCLWRTQDDYKLPLELQRVALCWVIFFLNILNDWDKNYTRNKIFDIFKEAICLAGESLDEGDPYLPYPEELMDFMTPTDILEMHKQENEILEMEDELEEKNLLKNDKICYLDVRTSKRRNLFVLDKSVKVMNDTSETDFNTSNSISSLSSCTESDTTNNEHVKQELKDAAEVEFKQNVEIKKLSVKTVLCILDFIFELFYNEFQYSIVQEALINPPEYIDETITDINFPKKLFVEPKITRKNISNAKINVTKNDTANTNVKVTKMGTASTKTKRTKQDTAEIHNDFIIPHENIQKTVENYKKYIFPLERGKTTEFMNTIFSLGLTPPTSPRSEDKKVKKAKKK